MKAEELGKREEWRRVGENETVERRVEARIGFSRLPKADVILSIEGAGTPGVTRISC